jgi:hypothetical protein
MLSLNGDADLAVAVLVCRGELHLAVRAAGESRGRGEQNGA